LYDSLDGGEINVKTVEHEMADMTHVADALRIECADELGDVSCDLAVTIADAQLIAQLIVGRIPSLPCANNGDVNKSGGVTIVDAQLIAQLIVGRIPSLPPP
jgi:hypothetical protein